MPLRVAVVGVGFASRVHLPVFAAHPGFELTAICTAHRERAREAAARFGVPRVYDDFPALLRDGGCDVVAVASPPATHAPYSVAAARAGLHVLCEKPTAVHAAEARAMCDAAAATGIVAVIDHEFRYLPGRARLHELVGQGRIGHPYHLTILQRAPWVGHARGWLTDASAGGGILGSLGSHLIDAARWLLGEITAVSGVAERHEAPGTAEDTATCLLQHAGGARTTIDLAGAVRERYARFEVHGSQGWLLLEETPDGDRLMGPDGEVALRDPQAGLPALRRPLPEERLAPPFAHLLDRFREAVAGGTPACATFRDGLRVQQVMDAIRAGSARPLPADGRPPSVEGAQTTGGGETG